MFDTGMVQPYQFKPEADASKAAPLKNIILLINQRTMD